MRWNYIKIAPNYAISNTGRVMRVAGGRGKRSWYVVKPWIINSGYFRVEIWKQGKPFRDCVHRLVALTFIGKCPKGKEVNHKNGVKTDNRVENLEYVTRSENQKHSYKIGLHPSIQGRESPNAKLKRCQIRLIKDLLAFGGITQKEIGVMFKVARQTIGAINTGQNWKTPKEKLCDKLIKNGASVRTPNYGMWV